MPQHMAVIGLGVMGRNLALNIESHGFPVAVYDRHREVVDAYLAGPGAGRAIEGTDGLPRLVGLLDQPRRLLMMIKAGAPVDSVLGQLAPLLDAGDIVVDGGNSLWTDTVRRMEVSEAKGLHFVGMGVSGGEEGARNGPSLMPGGDRVAYEMLEPVLTAIAAKTESGPCVTYVGAGGAGHFVKMVHNGIEYGDMQLIAEAYDLLHRGAGLDHERLAEVFAEWNEGELESFLIEITAAVMNHPDDLGEGPLIEKILDQAGQKGTGRWTTEAALALGVPIPTITAAVDARLISAVKDERVAAASHYPRPDAAPPGDDVIDTVRAGLYAAKIGSYAQGFALLRAASEEHGFGLDMREIARIWKGGCIIRAAFLDEIMGAHERRADLPNLLLDEGFRNLVAERIGALRRVVALGTERGIPLPGMSASLAYMDAYACERLPANLIQAQRDYFGAHTYRRTDRDGTFHTDWDAE